MNVLVSTITSSQRLGLAGTAVGIFGAKGYHFSVYLDYYLFKEGIKPMWEDPSNVNGGRWLVIASSYVVFRFKLINYFCVQVDKQKRQNKLDQYWLEVMMAVIGEQFEELGDHICGAVVNIRQKGDKVALWTRDAQADEVNTRIGGNRKKQIY